MTETKEDRNLLSCRTAPFTLAAPSCNAAVSTGNVTHLNGGVL